MSLGAGGALGLAAVIVLMVLVTDCREEQADPSETQSPPATMISTDDDS